MENLLEGQERPIVHLAVQIVRDRSADMDLVRRIIDNLQKEGFAVSAVGELVDGTLTTIMKVGKSQA
jgi:hypothetical protein